jgi:hypothetical protein
MLSLKLAKVDHKETIVLSVELRGRLISDLRSPIANQELA